MSLVVTSGWSGGRRINLLVQGSPRCERVLKNERTSGDEQVPHTLVFYMIRSIIRPSFILEQIPDLLDLIATADAVRSHAVEGSSVALLRQEYYAKEPSSHATLLTAKELKKIEGYVGNKESGRMHYMLLVKNLCILRLTALCRLSTEEEDTFLQDFGERLPSPVSEENLASDIEEYLDAVEEMRCTLEEYFPSSNTLKGSKWEI
ncbi:hypothetical protein F4604DRAFT_1675372 [Suillus subluteus]|nr:hypothetical protein F4604DRAFT_1675372 [Suillus subluteus]